MTGTTLSSFRLLPWCAAAVAALTLAGCGKNTATEAPTEPATGTAASASARAGDGPATPPKDARVRIYERWTGRILVPVTAPGGPPSDMPPRIIRDRAAFAAFIDLIPEHRIQKKQPAPKSDDPLLARPDIDFATRMVLVAFRPTTMYVHPVLDNPHMEGTKMVVHLGHPALGDSAHAAARMDVGTYAAIVVDRVDGDVEFRAAPSP